MVSEREGGGSRRGRGGGDVIGTESGRQRAKVGLGPGLGAFVASAWFLAAHFSGSGFLLAAFWTTAVASLASLAFALVLVDLIVRLARRIVVSARRAG